jgi:preprotein translocase subunit SecB
MKLVESDFNFLHYEIKNLNVNILHKTNEQLKYSTELGISKINYKENYAHFGIQLKVKAELDNKVYREITLEIIGFFSGFDKMEKKEFEKFCNLVGVPSLLQIARSTISSTTSMMNILPPVNLPLFNLQKSAKIQQRQLKKSKPNEESHNNQQQ